MSGRSVAGAETFMARALALARRARGRTWPNPMVGALVVKSGRVAGQGYHHKAGRPHAEVLAIRDAGPKARGADLYVTLEPCHLTGRTGPCTRLIEQTGIRRVFVGARDPNPRESGKGLSDLKRRGIRVTTGVLESECRDLNEVYNLFICRQRPYVLAKVATSLDGRIATHSGHSNWISSKESRRQAHRLRARSNAVLVGANTVRQDDPRLDVRHLKGRNPAVAVLDTQLTVSPDARLFSVRRGAPVLIYAGPRASTQRAGILEKAGASVIRVPEQNGLLRLGRVLKDLFRRGVYQLLVEGGGLVLGALVSARLIDRLEVHQAACLLGADGVPLAGFAGPERVSSAPRLVDVRFRRRGDDMCYSGRLQWPGTKRG